MLGPYILRREIGAGGVASVFIAEHKALKLDVALKVLRPENAAIASSVALFLGEPRAYKAVDHENAVEVTDVVSKGTQHYFTTELLRGRPLGEVLKQGRMSLARALHIARQVAAALAAAHDVDVVHRNLKPNNIFLTRKDGDGDVVKLLDLGASRMQADGDKTVVPGTVVGTPAYMAPEQLRQEQGDHRVDIYSFGVVLFELCVGRKPFVGEIAEIVRAQLLDPAPPASSLLPSGAVLPAPLDLLISRCLEKAVQDRPPSMHEVGLALSAIADLIGPYDADGADKGAEFFAVPKNTSGFTTVPVDGPGASRGPNEPTLVVPPPTMPSPPPNLGHGFEDVSTQVSEAPPQTADTAVTPPQHLEDVTADVIMAAVTRAEKSKADAPPVAAPAPSTTTPSAPAPSAAAAQKTPGTGDVDWGAIDQALLAPPPEARSKLPLAAAFGAGIIVVVGVVVALVSGGDGQPGSDEKPAVVAVTSPKPDAPPEAADAPADAPAPDAPALDAPTPAAPAPDAPAAPRKPPSAGGEARAPAPGKPLLDASELAPPPQIEVRFTSTPPGATVSIEGDKGTISLGVTPTSAKLPKGKKVKVEIALQGHKSVRQALTVDEGKSVDVTLTKREPKKKTGVNKEGDLLNPF